MVTDINVSALLDNIIQISKLGASLSKSCDLPGEDFYSLGSNLHQPCRTTRHWLTMDRCLIFWIHPEAVPQHDVFLAQVLESWETATNIRRTRVAWLAEWRKL